MNLLAPDRINVSALPTMSLDDRLRLPNVFAVYFVLDSTGSILYVGKAKSLYHRWVTHHLIEHLSMLPSIRIAYLVLDDATQLLATELRCIKHFRPPLNKKGSRPKVPGYQAISFRFPVEVLEKCRVIASQEERSLNEQIVYAVKRWLEAQDPQRSNADTSLLATAAP